MAFISLRFLTEGQSGLFVLFHLSDTPSTIKRKQHNL